MADLTSVLGGDFIPPEPSLLSPESQLADAIEQAGLTPPGTIHLDGELHRFSTNGKHDKSGWYVAFGDGIPAGRFGDWRLDLSLTWRADVGRPLSPIEEMVHAERMADAKRIRDEARDAKYEAAAVTAEYLWEASNPASADHPYLTRKQIEPHGARLATDGRLLLPLFDVEGFLTSVQYVADDGQKRFLTGGRAGGSYWWLGDMDSEGPVYLAEGFATAASIHQVTGQPAWITYSASNLVPVATTLRARIGSLRELVIVADTGEVGLRNAQEAAERAGGRVVQTPEIAPEITDANDYLNAGHDLAALLAPEKGDWLIPADTLAKKPAPLHWLVRHWLQKDALIMVHGPSGCGKTFLVLDWCLHLAAGLSQWQTLPVYSAPVVYLAGEGHYGMRARIAAWKQHHQVKKLRMHVSASGCDLNTASGYQKTAEALRRLKTPPRLIVVDTLHRFLSGNENQAQDVKTMLDACAGLQVEFGATVLLVHHTGVSEEAQHRARGSSAWRGALEIEISVAKHQETLSLTQCKAKDAEPALPIHLEMLPVAIDGWLDDEEEAVTSVVLIPGTAPVKATKPTKLDAHANRFERAWWATGAEEREELPYVTRAAMRDWLRGEGVKAQTIKNYLNSADETKFIGALLQAETIRVFDEGWVLQAPEQASAMLVRKSQKV